MLSLLQAELQKINGNRWMTGFTLWIFPMGGLAIFALVTLVVVLGANRGTLGLDDLRWTDQILLALALPTNVFGQVFLVGFCASVFAGESSHNTWKNIIPRQSRMNIILVKFLAVVLMILLALSLTALVTAIGSVLVLAVAGLPIAPSLQDANLGEFFRTYILTVLMALASTFIVASYAMLASLVTRSTFAGVVVGIGIMLFDQILPGLLALVSRILQIDSVVLLHHFTPSYNIANAGQWALTQTGFTFWTEWTKDAVPNSMEQSLLIISIWFVGLMGLSVWVFNRRDVA
jgi:ABC-type transport system involved in multi-copper enzyme maturation permease subunit